MPIARSKPPVPPNTSLLFGHNATALLPHRASYRRNVRLQIGQRAYSDRLLENRQKSHRQSSREREMAPPGIVRLPNARTYRSYYAPAGTCRVTTVTCGPSSPSPRPQGIDNYND
jgi:hypothetical protein